MQTRPFGKTGENLPILSLGCRRIVDEEGCDEAQAVAIIERALEGGIRYFDVAWSYADGQAEERLGLVSRERRDAMWIASKVIAGDRDGALRQLEESLSRLHTDHLDEWRLHNVSTYERLDVVTGKGGALEALIEAREQGIVRHIGITNHSDPQVQIEAMRRYPFETALVTLSALDHFIYSFADEFLPLAREQRVGIIAMKALGYKMLAHCAENALRYVFDLPVCTVAVGCSSVDELEMDLAIAEACRPMTDIERLDLYRQVLPLVSPENMPWKADDFDNPRDWLARDSGSVER